MLRGSAPHGQVDRRIPGRMQSANAADVNAIVDGYRPTHDELRETIGGWKIDSCTHAAAADDLPAVRFASFCQSACVPLRSRLPAASSPKFPSPDARLPARAAYRATDVADALSPPVP
jgi:hypothetical protein